MALIKLSSYQFRVYFSYSNLVGKCLETCNCNWIVACVRCKFFLPKTSTILFLTKPIRLQFDAASLQKKAGIHIDAIIIYHYSIRKNWYEWKLLVSFSWSVYFWHQVWIFQRYQCFTPISRSSLSNCGGLKWVVVFPIAISPAWRSVKCDFQRRWSWA